MKKGFYIRLAGEGISKNRKLYFPYILTCICMIMMYYIVSFLSISKELASIRGGEMLQGLLSMGVFVVAVFALIFLYYTNSFLIRKRKKELGLYNILGMGKRNLVRILLWENILTAVISLVIGIVFGILFLGGFVLLGIASGLPAWQGPVFVAGILVISLALAYMMREQYIGDPQHAHVDVAGILSKEFADEHIRNIRMDRLLELPNVAPPMSAELSLVVARTSHVTYADAATRSPMSR